MATPYWDEPKRTPLGMFDTGTLIFFGVLFVAAGAFWHPTSPFPLTGKRDGALVLNA